MLFLLTMQHVSAQPASIHKHASYKRVVALAPHLVEDVYAIGAEDRLVAVSAHSDYPPAALRLPVIADAFTVNLESLLAQKPDLVLVWRSSVPVGFVERLRAFDIASYESEPHTIEEMLADLIALGNLLDRQAPAAAVVKALRARLLRLQPAPSLRTFVQLSAPEIYTVSNAHFLSDVMRRCGYVNVFGDLTALAPKISDEAVLAARIDVVLAFADIAVAAGETWKPRGLSVVGLPTDLLSRPGPRLVDGAEKVCELAHAHRPLANRPLANRPLANRSHANRN